MKTKATLIIIALLFAVAQPLLAADEKKSEKATPGKGGTSVDRLVKSTDTRPICPKCGGRIDGAHNSEKCVSTRAKLKSLNGKPYAWVGTNANGKETNWCGVCQADWGKCRHTKGISINDGKPLNP